MIYEPFLGYQVYSLGNQETGPYESGGGFILPDTTIGDCEAGYEIDPTSQTCVAIKFNPPSSVQGSQAMTLGCTNSDSPNFNPNATTDDGSCSPHGGYNAKGEYLVLAILAVLGLAFAG